MADLVALALRIEQRGASIVLRNAIERPGYCPYCMRCPGLVRMRQVGHMQWRCCCGAEHDERACRHIFDVAASLRARAATPTGEM